MPPASSAGAAQEPLGAFDTNYTPSLPGSGSFEAIAALPDGGVVVGGTSGSAAVLTSFNADGTSDGVDYSVPSGAVTEIRAVAVQPVSGGFTIVTAGIDGSNNFSLDRYGLV